MVQPVRLRSLLYAPANRPDMIAKMPRFNPHEQEVADAVQAAAAEISARWASRRGARSIAQLRRDSTRPVGWEGTRRSESRRQ